MFVEEFLDSEPEIYTVFKQFMHSKYPSGLSNLVCVSFPFVLGECQLSQRKLAYNLDLYIEQVTLLPCF